MFSESIHILEMYDLGHKGITLLLYSPILLGLLILEYFTLAVLGLLITLSLYSIPDKDIKIRKGQSKVNDKLPVVNLKNHFEFLFITHRGITHTVWFATIVGILFTVLASFLLVYAEPIFFAPDPIPVYAIGGFAMYGILTHFAGDVITPRGITPFAPLYNKRFTLSLVPSKSEQWNNRFYWLGVRFTVLTVVFWIITQGVIFYYGFDGYAELARVTITLIETVVDTYLN